MVAHYPIVEWLVSGKKRELINMRKAIEGSSCNTILLSCENFYHALGEHQIRLLSEILEPFNVKIICYVRRQDLAAESAWKQQVRVRLESTSFEIFIKKHKDPTKLSKVQLNYFRMLYPWSQFFGEEKIKLRIFQNNSFIGGDLLRDFFSTICFSDAYDSNLECFSGSNKSISNGFIDLIRIINDSNLVSKENHNDLVNAIDSSSATFDNSPLLDIKGRREILENYSEVNEQLFNKYMSVNDSVGFDVSDLY
jgi:hypothetical protein